MKNLKFCHDLPDLFYYDVQESDNSEPYYGDRSQYYLYEDADVSDSENVSFPDEGDALDYYDKSKRFIEYEWRSDSDDRW